jgi:hypothetical protein
MVRIGGREADPRSIPSGKLHPGDESVASVHPAISFGYNYSDSVFWGNLLVVAVVFI